MIVLTLYRMDFGRLPKRWLNHCAKFSFEQMVTKNHPDLSSSLTKLYYSSITAAKLWKIRKISIE